jgi:hypothetical protein
MRNPDSGKSVKIVRDQDVGEATHRNEGRNLDSMKIKPQQRVRRAPRKAKRDWQRPLSEKA